MRGFAAVCVVIGGAALAAACDGSPDKAAPGTERGECRADGTCDPGLACLSDLCVRPVDAGLGPDADETPDAGVPDASPDAGPDPAGYFDTHVAPIVSAQCASCHATGTGGAPAFGTTYASYVAYSGPRGKLADCTLTESLLFTRGAHAGPAFGAVDEAEVRAWLDVQAYAVPGCSFTAGKLPSTGAMVAAAGDYSLDLSVLGASLEDGSVQFTVTPSAGSLQLSNLRVTAGASGLRLVNPFFETCAGGIGHPSSEPGMLRMDVPANVTQMIGDGTVSVSPVVVGEKFAMRFHALLTLDGAKGAPIDSGGACDGTQ